MVDEPAKIDNFKDRLDVLISDAHKEGLNYWAIMRVVLDRYSDLMVQSSAEYYQKGGE